MAERVQRREWCACHGMTAEEIDAALRGGATLLEDADFEAMEEEAANANLVYAAKKSPDGSVRHYFNVTLSIC